MINWEGNREGKNQEKARIRINGDKNNREKATIKKNLEGLSQSPGKNRMAGVGGKVYS